MDIILVAGRWFLGPALVVIKGRGRLGRGLGTPSFFIIMYGIVSFSPTLHFSYFPVTY